MSKILLLNNSNHNSLGGIETYINNLLDLNIFDKHDIIDELYVYYRGEFNKKNKRINQSEIISSNKINYEYILDYYDLIIVNCTWTVREKINLKKILKSNKTILVQHSNPKFFKKFFFSNWFDLIDSGFKKFLENLFFKKNKFLISKNIFKYAKNVVFFTKYDHEKIKGKYELVEYILPTTLHSKIEDKSICMKNRNFIHISRCSSEKRLDYIKSIFKKNNLSIDIIGISSSNQSYINFLGQMSNNEINEILKLYKYLFLSSRYEGFPIVILEAIAKGVIVISNKCFEGWKIFPNELKLFFWKRKKELLKIIELLKNINTEKYNVATLNLFNEKFSKDKFSVKWKKTINSVLKKTTLNKL